MKKLFRVMLVAIVAICTTNIAFAQNAEKKTETKTTTKKKVVKKKQGGKKTTETKEQKVKSEKKVKE